MNKLQVQGRSPYGERGLKYRRDIPVQRGGGRSPYGERGLKYCRLWDTTPETARRSPYGERGLK